MMILGHNQGLGDCILMSGSVRYWAYSVGEVHYLVLPRNVSQIQHLYRDMPQVRVRSLGSVHGKRITSVYKRLKKQFRRANIPHKIFNWGIMQNWEADINRLGLDSRINHWGEAFYRMMGVPYTARYDHWFIKRDAERENRVFRQLNLDKTEDYIFLSGKRRKQLKNLKIHSSKRIVSPDEFPDLSSTHIFDWIGIIENASEIHTVDTSWFHLIKQLRLLVPKYYHRPPYRIIPATAGTYVNDEFDNGWTIVNY